MWTQFRCLHRRCVPRSIQRLYLLSPFSHQPLLLHRCLRLHLLSCSPCPVACTHALRSVNRPRVSTPTQTYSIRSRVQSSARPITTASSRRSRQSYRPSELFRLEAETRASSQRLLSRIGKPRLLLVYCPYLYPVRKRRRRRPCLPLRLLLLRSLWGRRKRWNLHRSLETFPVFRKMNRQIH